MQVESAATNTVIDLLHFILNKYTGGNLGNYHDIVIS